MPRYIDLDALLEQIQEPMNWTDSDAELQKQLDYQSFKLLIENQPIADVEPRSECEKWYAEYHKIKEDLKQEKNYHRETEKLCERYLIELSQTKQEVEKLSIELEAMRGAANSYKMHYEKAKQEVAREIKENAFDYPTLADWYISSVNDKDTPVWTDEHIEELLNDFYIIPKEFLDGN